MLSTRSRRRHTALLFDFATARECQLCIGHTRSSPSRIWLTLRFTGRRHVNFCQPRNWIQLGPKSLLLAYTYARTLRLWQRTSLYTNTNFETLVYVLQTCVWMRNDYWFWACSPGWWYKLQFWYFKIHSRMTIFFTLSQKFRHIKKRLCLMYVIKIFLFLQQQSRLFIVNVEVLQQDSFTSNFL